MSASIDETNFGREQKSHAASLLVSINVNNCVVPWKGYFIFYCERHARPSFLLIFILNLSHAFLRRLRARRALVTKEFWYWSKRVYQFEADPEVLRRFNENILRHFLDSSKKKHFLGLFTQKNWNLNFLLSANIFRLRLAFKSRQWPQHGSWSFFLKWHVQFHDQVVQRSRVDP